MIEHPTVFILGAGASMPYGLPSGEHLRSSICGAANSGSRTSQVLQHELRFSAQEIGRFADQFLRSGQRSIDAFLSRRAELARLGKLCIAVELISRERDADLIRSGINDDWYALLWEALTRDANSVEEVKKNPVRVITFNYDRSFEHRCFQAAKHTFDATDEVALDVVRSMGILHVYGALGDYTPTTNQGARTYSDELNADTIQVAAEGIRVIPESRDGDPVFEEARRYIGQARRICFLGFGFDPLNLSRLRAPEALNQNKAGWVVASTLGKTNREVDWSRARVCGEARQWSAFNASSSMTIRESGVLL